MDYFRAGRTLIGTHNFVVSLRYCEVDTIQCEGASGAGGLRHFDLVFQVVHCPSLIDVDCKCNVLANNGAYALKVALWLLCCVDRGGIWLNVCARVLGLYHARCDAFKRV